MVRAPWQRSLYLARRGFQSLEEAFCLLRERGILYLEFRDVGYYKR